MAVFAVFESGLDAKAKGDSDSRGVFHAFGAFQLQGAPLRVAYNPRLAAARWLAFAKENEALCTSNAREERFASLASGRCDRGRVLARRREMWAAKVLEAVEETEAVEANSLEDEKREVEIDVADSLPRE